MKINAFADVSLRAMMVLAAVPDGSLLTTQSIADAVGTPYNHVSKAMAKLRELGVIDVERGRNGGSRLNDAGRRATVGQLLRLLNTRADPADCHSLNGDCPLINECRLARRPVTRPRGFLPGTRRHCGVHPSRDPPDGTRVPGHRAPSRTLTPASPNPHPSGLLPRTPHPGRSSGIPRTTLRFGYLFYDV